MRCWKILVAHTGLSQMKRGTRTCSLVGWPTIGQIGHPPLDVVAQPALRPALGADRVDRDRGAEQVRELTGHGRVGDGHPEFDGAADGVGEQAGGSVQSGSWGVRCAV